MNKCILDKQIAREPQLNCGTLKLPGFADPRELDARFQNDREGVPIGKDAVSEHKLIRDDAQVWVLAPGIAGDQRVEEQGELVAADAVDVLDG